MNILRPSVEVSELTKEADKAREAEARKQAEARKAAAARKDDRGSLNLEQALLIALLVLIATASLFSLGTAVAAKYEQAANMDVLASVEAAEPIPAGTLAVSIRDASGAPASNAYAFGAAGQQVAADTNGRAVFTGLPPGDYRIFAFTMDGRWLSSEQWVSLTDTQGGALSLTLARNLNVQ